MANVIITSGNVQVRVTRTQFETREVKWLGINAIALGDNVIVPAVVGKKIRALTLWFIATLAVGIQIKSGANVKIDAMAIAANQPFTPSTHPSAWIVESNIGEDLILNLAVAVNVRGAVAYVEV